MNQIKRGQLSRFLAKELMVGITVEGSEVSPS